MKKEIDKAYRHALLELGEKEFPGIKSNKRIQQYHSMTTLKSELDSVPWCSAFVCWCLEYAGIRSTRSAAARSYLTWGQAVETPYEGCIVVLKRGAHPTQGHVGFFMKEDGDQVYVLGGNQNNMVCIRGYPKSSVLAYRESGLTPT